jgi:hypothetical protein
MDYENINKNVHVTVIVNSGMAVCHRYDEDNVSTQ